MQALDRLANAELINPDTDYLVGVSGGRDSMVLLHWLVALGCEQLTVCHFNHSLRGADSDGDAQLVQSVAEQLGFEFCGQQQDSKVFAEQSKLSLETAAREHRYAFFAKVAGSKNCPRVILAHHADDQNETILMNLFRGSGLKGLAGMQPVSYRTIDGQSIELIRPFLKVPRQEIDDYLQAHEIVFREDATNSQPIAVRNRVRHELLPLVDEIFSRDATGALQRLSEIASIEASAAKQRAEDWLAEHQDESGELPVRILRTLPEADLHHVLHHWLGQQKVSNYGLKEVRMIIEIIESDGKPSKVNLPGGQYARRRAGVVFIDR